MTAAAAALVAANEPLWARITGHPFVLAAGDGTLPPAAFDRWLVADHYFVVGFRRFLARLLETAPDEDARDLLAGGLAALTPELQLFRRAAAERALDLDAEPGPTTLGYTAFVQAAPADGFPVGLTVLYGAERAYLDAWTAVRARTDNASPYAAFVRNWSSEGFRAYVDALGRLLDRLVASPLQPSVAGAFSRVVRFELRFWDAVHAGETWDSRAGV